MTCEISVGGGKRVDRIFGAAKRWTCPGRGREGYGGGGAIADGDGDRERSEVEDTRSCHRRSLILLAQHGIESAGEMTKWLTSHLSLVSTFASSSFLPASKLSLSLSFSSLY